MLAARLYGKDDLRVENAPDPLIASGDVLLKVSCACICGTDIRMIRNGEPGAGAAMPLILGHEFAGEVVQAGGDVEGIGVGEFVVVAPNMGCGECELCVSGRTHLCPKYRAFGIHLDGAFAQYVRIPEAAIRQGNVIPLPDGLSAEEAALAEPLSCAYSAFERCRPSRGESVLVMGAGPVGLIHAKLAAMAGAEPVALSDPDAGRLEQVRAIDSRFVPLLSDGLESQIDKLTGGRGVDVCITACPSPAAQEQALRLCAFEGRVCFFGGLPKSQSLVRLDTNLIHYRQLTVTGTTRSSVRQFRRTLELLNGGQLSVSELITSRIPLEACGEAVRAAAGYKGLKTAIKFD